MKRIVYIIAPQNPEDIAYVCEHAKILSHSLQRNNLDECQFGALILMERPGANKGVVAVHRAEDHPALELPFYDNPKHFIGVLNGYSYVFKNTHSSEDSICEAFRLFSRQEGGSGMDLDTTYQIVCFDFRSNAGKFLGNDSDIMVEEMRRSFRNRIGLQVFHRQNNDNYYSVFNGTKNAEYLQMISNQRSNGILCEFFFEDKRTLKASINNSVGRIIEGTIGSVAHSTLISRRKNNA